MIPPTAIEIGSLITCDPGIKRGSPHLSGSGVLVRSVVRWHQTGLMPEEIVAKYGSLRLEQVHAALAYYYANRAEVDAEIRRVDKEAAGIEQAARSAR
jgi:uncharacterized protein (DUF433 family)